MEGNALAGTLTSIGRGEESAVDKPSEPVLIGTKELLMDWPDWLSQQQIGIPDLK